MIIKSTRTLLASVTRFLTAHLLDGGKNDAVAVIAGGRDHLAACVAFAEEKGCRYAVRHFIIAPEVEIGRDGAVWVAEKLAVEFDFQPGAWTLVEHRKQKVRGGPAAHYHLAVAEVDPAQRGGKVLSSRWTFPRQEKIARLAELHFGHSLTPGAHHAAVVARLDADGNAAAADALRSAEPARGPAEPRRTVPAAVMGAMDAAGLSSAETLDQVRELFEVAADAAELAELLADMGLHIAPGGKKATTMCVYAGERVVGALHRIVGISAPEARAFMQDRPKAVLRPAEIGAEIHAQRVACQPVPVDRAKLDGHRESLASTRRMIADYSPKNAAHREEEAVLTREIAAFGWIARRFTRKADYAAKLARAAVVKKLAADGEAFVERITGLAVPIREAERKEARRVATLEAHAAEKHQKALARLARLEALIRTGGLVFADLEELRAFLRDGEAEPDNGPAAVFAFTRKP